jgi:hypothetical protein
LWLKDDVAISSFMAVQVRHKERGEADVEEEGEGEHERRRRRGEEKDGRFREPKQPSQKGLRET